MKKVSDIVIDFLAKKGTTDVFTLPGGGCMHLVDSLGRHPNLTPHCLLHEQACAIAADAYAQYTNTPAVLLVTTGPGGTNTLTGVAASWIDSTPLFIISGQAKTNDLLTGKGVRQMGIQEVDIVSMVSSITKYAKTILNPTDIPNELEKAWTIANSGRKGPVWLDIPLDIQGDKIKTHLETIEYSQPIKKSDLDQKNFSHAVYKCLNEAKRPVVLVGHGIRASNCELNTKQLLNDICIPTLTTWRMADFMEEDHPLYGGMPGIVGQRGANFIQQNSDCLIILGARLDLCQTGFNHSNFAKHAKKIIVDIDENEINKLNMTFEISEVCDVSHAIDALNSHRDLFIGDFSEWQHTCKQWKAEYPPVTPSKGTDQRPINTYDFIDVLSDLMKESDLLIPGSSGACAEITQQAFRSKPNQRIINSPGLGAMGFGLSAAIGACLASGKKRTICVDGDGGIQLNIQELQTLKRLKIPVVIFVLNNSGYVSISAMQKNRFDGNYVASTPDSGLELPDICEVAKAYKIKSMRISMHSEIRETVKFALAYQAPIVCDVIVDPDIPTAPKLSSQVLPNGKIVSKPMEDLWPFLDRDEYKKHILYE